MGPCDRPPERSPGRAAGTRFGRMWHRAPAIAERQVRDCSQTKLLSGPALGADEQCAAGNEQPGRAALPDRAGAGSATERKIRHPPGGTLQLGGAHIPRRRNSRAALLPATFRAMPDSQTNIAELTVSELSASLKRTVED